MTISSTSNKIIYSGNGATTSFPFTFPAIAAADILAYYTDALGNITTLTQGSGTTQYQVTLNAVVLPNPTAAGGTVTYNPSGTPIASGTSLTIIRTLSLIQATSLASQGNIYPAVIEQALDSLLAQTQQLNELLGRNITVAVSDPTPSALPAAAARSGKYLSFDSSGNPIVSTTVTGTAVSAAMIPVIGAATLAAGRTAFGLGNIAVENIGAGLQDDGAGTLRANLEVTTADNTNQTVTSAFHNTQRAAIGPITYTLPRANTLWNGFGFRIENSIAGVVTFAINVNDNLQGYTSGTSFVLGRGGAIDIWTDAAASGIWYYRLVGGKHLAGDGDVTGLPTHREVVTLTAYTAPRTYTLPGASAFKVGALLTISDQANAITSTNTLTIARAGADGIIAQGLTVASLALFTAGASITLMSDGASLWNIVSLRQGVKVTRLLSGAAATFTATVGASRHRVTGCGGGGGGGAVTLNAAAVAGGTSSFQVNGTGTSWTCIGGALGAAAAGAGGAGGSGGTDGTTGTLIDRVIGGRGQDGGGSAAAGANGLGGMGGSNPRAGAGAGRNSAAGTAGAANTGAGGGGAGGGSAQNGGAGGGASELVSFWVTGMTGAIYTVGAGGAGGTAGTNAGGAGAAGIWIVEEFFD